MPPRIPIYLVQDAPTVMQGSSFDLAPSTANVPSFRIFPGGPVGQHRKQIIITNEDNSDKLYIALLAGSSPVKIMTVFPNTNITLLTSADVVLYNPSTTNKIDGVQVIEIFYRTQ